MNKLSSTAKKLDTFFKVVNIALTIAVVSCFVGLGILAAGYLFDLAPEQIGTNWNIVDLGPLELTIADAYVPDHQVVMLQAATEFFYALICLIAGRISVKCIRDILAPMTQSQPFHNTVSHDLKKLAKCFVFLGVAFFVLDTISRITMTYAFHLNDLILSEKITNILYNYTFDGTFLLFGAVLYLLSYIFRYGEELQQLSDETL